jgi:hypothetical protein
MEEEEKQCEIPEETSEERFAIENYDDIFSVFDPRPTSVRGLSEDFLSEARRATLSKNSDKVDFIIMIPEKNRKPKEEKMIRERLKRYFKKYSGIEEKEKNKTVKKGIIFNIVGIILMLIATYLIYISKGTSLISNFLIVLLEPGGWFLFWKGLELALFESKEKAPNLEFYEKMVNANIRFGSSQ